MPARRSETRKIRAHARARVLYAQVYICMYIYILARPPLLLPWRRVREESLLSANGERCEWRLLSSASAPVVGKKFVAGRKSIFTHPIYGWKVKGEGGDLSWPFFCRSLCGVDAPPDELEVLGLRGGGEFLGGVGN